MNQTADSPNDLTQGSIYQHMIRIGLPAALGMVFNTLYNLTDNWFAGQISDTALSGLSIASIVFALFAALAAGLQNGTSAMVAVDIGSGRRDHVKTWIWNANSIAWMMSVVIVMTGLLFAKDLLGFLSQNDAVIEQAWQYTSVILYGNVSFALTSVAAGALIAHGNTSAYRNVLIVGFFVNWVLNYLFIHVMDWGVAGLAWSTLIIKGGSCVYLYRVLSREAGAGAGLGSQIATWGPLLKQILPASMNMLTIIIGGFITIYFIAIFGDDAVAGYSVGIRLEQLLLLPAFGVNASVMAVVGQSFGAGMTERIKETYFKSLKLTFVVSLVFIPIMIFLSPLMMTQFSQSAGIVDVGVYYLRVDALAFYGYMVLFCSVAVLQAIKQPLFPMVIGIMRQMVLPIAAFYVLINHLNQGLHAIFWAIVVIVLLSALVTFFYTLSRLRRL